MIEELVRGGTSQARLRMLNFRLLKFTAGVYFTRATR